MTRPRILVVRPEADGRRTAARLAERGCDALLAPVLTVEATHEPPPEGPFDAIVLTSANAVPALASMRGCVGNAALFAVGPRTAEAAAAAGLPPAEVADGDAQALAERVAGSLPDGASVLHVAGRDRKPEPAETLVRRGCKVVTWTAYAARPAERLAEAAAAALRQGGVDAALQYSRRTAGVLMALAADAGCLIPLLSLRHLCISEDAAAPLRAAGARRLIVAARPDEDCLLESLPRAVP